MKPTLPDRPHFCQGECASNTRPVAYLNLYYLVSYCSPYRFSAAELPSMATTLASSTHIRGVTLRSASKVQAQVARRCIVPRAALEAAR